MPYETDIKRMEEIAELLRDNQTTLDKAVALFEEGVKIANRVEKELTEIERKVEILLNPVQETEDNTIRTEPFEAL